MNEERKTILTLEHMGHKMTWEGDECADLESIMTGFVGCLRGISFGDWVVKHIKEWCEEHIENE